MSELRDNPDLMMEVLAKLAHRSGGYLKVSAEDYPSGPFNLKSRIGNGVVELMLEGATAESREPVN